MIDASAAIESVRTFDHHGPELLPLVQFLASGGIGLGAAIVLFARTISGMTGRSPTVDDNQAHEGRPSSGRGATRSRRRT